MRVHGNHAAARGWAGRCERLLAQAEPCAEIGRVVLVRALATNDWAQIEGAAEQAIEIAKRFGDTDYEALAVAYSGLAMLSTGRLSQGLALLDEAMAAATAGEVRAPEAVGQIYCALLTGCERTVDLQRAEQWSQAARPFLTAYGKIGFTGTCRAMRVDALVRLADLRVRQGRLDEAAGLLEGSEDHPDAQRPLAELELARGRPNVAAGLLERRIHQLGAGSVQAAPLLACLVEVRIAGGDSSAARRAAGALAELSGAAGGSVRGLALLASGLATAAEGGDAVPELEVALDHLQRAEMAWEASRARLAIAEAISDRNPEFAVPEARLAMAGFEAIGARPGADRAASLLRQLGVRPAGGATGLTLDDYVGFAVMYIQPFVNVNDQESLMASDLRNVLRRYEGQVADAGMARLTQELFSADFDWFRGALDGSDGNLGVTPLLPFQQRPLVRLPGGAVLPLSYRLLMEKASTGAYWVLHEHFRRQSARGLESFTKFIGALHQEYVADLLKRAYPAGGKFTAKVRQLRRAVDGLADGTWDLPELDRSRIRHILPVVVLLHPFPAFAPPWSRSSPSCLPMCARSAAAWRRPPSTRCRSSRTRIWRCWRCRWRPATSGCRTSCAARSPTSSPGTSP